MNVRPGRHRKVVVAAWLMPLALAFASGCSDAVSSLLGDPTATASQPATTSSAPVTAESQVPHGEHATGSHDASPSASPQASASPENPAPTYLATASVRITNFAFEPAQVYLQKGGTVTFINEDGAPHTVSPQSGAQFQDSGNLDPGGSVVISFGTSGDQAYLCNYHPSMTGIVTVE